MVDYVRLAATANRLIKKNGVLVQLTKPRRDDYVPEEGTADDLSSQTFSGFAIRDPDSDYQQSFVDGTRTRVEFAPLWISMPDAAPETGDTLVMSGKTWTVGPTTPLVPGPVVLLHKTLVRNP